MGHCPQHEAPHATDKAMLACIQHMEEYRAWVSQQKQQEQPLAFGSSLEKVLPVGARWEVQEAGGRTIKIQRVDGSPRLVSEQLARLAWELLERFSSRPSGTV